MRPYSAAYHTPPAEQPTTTIAGSLLTIGIFAGFLVFLSYPAITAAALAGFTASLAANKYANRKSTQSATSTSSKSSMTPSAAGHTPADD